MTRTGGSRRILKLEQARVRMESRLARSGEPADESALGSIERVSDPSGRAVVGSIQRMATRSLEGAGQVLTYKRLERVWRAGSKR